VTTGSRRWLVRAGTALTWVAPHLRTIAIDRASAAPITPGRCAALDVRLSQATPSGACSGRDDFRLQRACTETEPFILRIELRNDVRDCDGLTVAVFFAESHFQVSSNAIAMCRHQQAFALRPGVGRGELTFTLDALAGGEQLTIDVPFVPARSPLCGPGTGILGLGAIFTVQISGPCCPFGDRRTTALLTYGS